MCVLVICVPDLFSAHLLVTWKHDLYRLYYPGFPIPWLLLGSAHGRHLQDSREWEEREFRILILPGQLILKITTLMVSGNNFRSRESNSFPILQVLTYSPSLVNPVLYL